MNAGPKSLKVLAFIRDHPDCRAIDVADHLWPNALMHHRSSNQGRGACRGKAAWLCGGSLVGKLIKAGWVYPNFGPPTTYHLSQAGRITLDTGAQRPASTPHRTARPHRATAVTTPVSSSDL